MHTRTAVRLHFVASLAIATLAVPGSIEAQGLLPIGRPERCSAATPADGAAAEWLGRAAARVFPPSLSGRVLRYRASYDVPFWEQSDRMYPPFIPNVQESVRWLDPATGVEGRQPVEAPVKAGRYPSQLYGPISTFAGRDTSVRPVPDLHPFGATARLLNPWIVLLDWQAHPADARVVQKCLYRDYMRVVLQRGTERLYLSASDGVPFKLERTEPHYLWGQVNAEYMWNTWWAVTGGGLYPIAAFRQFDGTTYESVGLSPGSAELIPVDSAPRLAVPAVAPMSDRVVIAAPGTDTVRVNDHTFQLVTPAYTETVTLQRDTVFLLDATSGESRARQDSAWIAALFPGRHPVTLVVTDLAWPHISSVRFWVARGATIVSHRMSEEFIQRVVNRRWTLEPDALEKARATAKLRFRAVDDSVRFAGGDVSVHAFLGNTTEGALAVWLPKDRFLWAGDFIQRTPASPYYYDVVLTARALGFHPDKVGAQHIKLTDWASVDRRVPERIPPVGGLDASYLHDGTDRYNVLRQSPGRDSAPAPFGTLTMETRLAKDAHGRTIHRVATFQWSAGVVIDSVVTRAAALRAVSEISHQPTKLMHLYFNGGRVTGVVQATDKAADTVNAAFPEPVFNSSDTDMIICSLPLREGYRAIIPQYVYEQGGVDVDTVSVGPKTSLRLAGVDREAWRVETRGSALTMTYWVDAKTRQLLQRDIVGRQTGLLTRMVLAPSR